MDTTGRLDLDYTNNIQQKSKEFFERYFLLKFNREVDIIGAPIRGDDLHPYRLNENQEAA